MLTSDSLLFKYDSESRLESALTDEHPDQHIKKLLENYICISRKL